jgi:ketosteroid isomerase-like protein
VGVEENKEVVRRQFEFLNAGDVDGAVGLWAPTGLNHGRATSPAGLARVYASLNSVRERHVLHEMIAEGDWVVVRTTCSGVHAAAPSIPINGGMFEGLAPTGRTYEDQHIHMFRVVEGLIVEHQANRDDLGAAKQIGLVLRQP